MKILVSWYICLLLKTPENILWIADVQWLYLLSVIEKLRVFFSHRHYKFYCLFQNIWQIARIRYDLKGGLVWHWLKGINALSKHFIAFRRQLVTSPFEWFYSFNKSNYTSINLTTIAVKTILKFVFIFLFSEKSLQIGSY